MRDEDENQPIDEGGGLSTGKKVIAGAALGVAVPAAVGVVRKLISGDDDEGRSRSTASSRSRANASGSTGSRTKRTPAKRSSSSTTTKRTSAARTKTREQLYRQATRLEIAGRSQMSKAQLERAVGRAKAK